MHPTTIPEDETIDEGVSPGLLESLVSLDWGAEPVGGSQGTANGLGSIGVVPGLPGSGSAATRALQAPPPPPPLRGTLGSTSGGGGVPLEHAFSAPMAQPMLSISSAPVQILSEGDLVHRTASEPSSVGVHARPAGSTQRPRGILASFSVGSAFLREQLRKSGQPAHPGSSPPFGAAPGSKEGKAGLGSGASMTAIRKKISHAVTEPSDKLVQIVK